MARIAVALPKVGKFLPALLTDGNSLIYGVAEGEKYTAAILISLAVRISIFNKKRL